jgi:hypothetical protein
VNPTITLDSGNHTLTLTVVDNMGLTDSDTVVVDVIQPPSISLSAVGYKVRGKHTGDLTWSGSNSLNIDVYRDDILITTTANDGFYTDNIGQKGGEVTYTYMICEEGTSVCSNEAVVVF